MEVRRYAGCQPGAEKAIEYAECYAVLQLPSVVFLVGVSSCHLAMPLEGRTRGGQCQILDGSPHGQLLLAFEGVRCSGKTLLGRPEHQPLLQTVG